MQYSAPERGDSVINAFYLSLFGSRLRVMIEIRFGRRDYITPCLEHGTNAGSYCKAYVLEELCTAPQCWYPYLVDGSFPRHIPFVIYGTFHGPIWFTCFRPIHRIALCIEGSGCVLAGDFESLFRHQLPLALYRAV